MILNDELLSKWAGSGGIEPFDPSLINPASIDLRLGHLWRDMKNPGKIWGAYAISLTPSRIDYWLYRLLKKPVFNSVLAITYETVTMPDNHAASIKLKTTPSRKGLGHPIADWVDPGYSGKLTLMLHAIQPIKLYYLQPVVQLVVHNMHLPALIPYGKKGHYQGQTIPTMAWDSKGE